MSSLNIILSDKHIILSDKHIYCKVKCTDTRNNPTVL